MPYNTIQNFCTKRLYKNVLLKNLKKNLYIKLLMNLTGLHFTSTNLPDKEICFWWTFGKRVFFHCLSWNILQDNGNFCSSCLHCGKCHHTLFLYFSLESEIYLGIDVHLKLLKTIGHNSYATPNIPVLYFLNQQILA